ncbi:MAG: translesion DNA synthesis-associated protein ImuA [Propionivibrio sp.]
MRNTAALAAAVSLDEILARADVWCADQLASAALPTLASGFAALDAELPGGGWPRGALCEILADAVSPGTNRSVGIGELSLLMPALARMRAEGRWSLLVAPPFRPNGPALAAFGVDLARLAVVTPAQSREIAWAIEHALASGAFGCVLGWCTGIDARQLRRLQVAVAGHDTLAFLFRPLNEQIGASPAPLRLALSAGPGGTLGVDLLKRRGPPCARTLLLDVARPRIRSAGHHGTSIGRHEEESPDAVPHRVHLHAVRSTQYALNHAPRFTLARIASAGAAAGSIRPASVA